MYGLVESLDPVMLVNAWSVVGSWFPGVLPWKEGVLIKRVE
jgi:hypothetical protein